MFTVIYRWRIKDGCEDQFIERWSAITKYYLNNMPGARGSRLHHGEDGIWYAYAQWEGAVDREAAFRAQLPDGLKISDLIEESFPEIRLEIKADFLIGEENVKKA